MKRLLLFTLLIITLTSCNTLKRLDKLAVKYGQELIDTIQIDTVLKIPGISFDASYFKKYSIKELVGQSDTTRINLQDGTRLVLVDQYSAESSHGMPERIGIKRQAYIFRKDEEIHIKKNRQYKRISVTPPDKLDVLLASLKWIAISLLSIAMGVWFIRKLIS